MVAFWARPIKRAVMVWLKDGFTTSRACSTRNLSQYIQRKEGAGGGELKGGGKG